MMIKDSFKDAHESSKAAFERENKLQETPVTKAEMDQCIAQRARPMYTRDLTPDGCTKQAVDKKSEADNERRIGFIRKRLSRMEGQATRDFERSR